MQDALAHSSDKPASRDELVPDIDNPAGFFESHHLTELNEALLHSIGASWHTPPLFPVTWPLSGRIETFHNERPRFKQYALTNAWVDKDPRLCITHAAFLHILLKRAPIVSVVRDPLEVALSLFARNSIPIERGLGIWFLYNFHLAANLQVDDILLDYSELVDANNDSLFSGLADSINRLLISQGLQPCNSSQWKLIFKKRVDKSLRRSVWPIPPITPLTTVSPSLLMVCKDLYEKISKANTDKKGVFKEAFSSIPWNILELIDRHSVCSPTPTCLSLLRSKDEQISRLANEVELLKSASASKPYLLGLGKIKSLLGVKSRK